MDGRKRNEYLKVDTPEVFALRGFMICAECGRQLTASASKGRNQYYNYYHCKRPCKVRFKSEEVNDYFKRHLRSYVPKPGMAKLFRAVVCDTFEDFTSIFVQDRKNLIQQITEQNNRVTKSKELLLADAFTAEEYKELKNEAEKNILKLEAKILDITEKLNHDHQVSKVVDKSLKNLENLTELYENADTEGKQFIVGSIFPKKFVFNGTIDRTAETNLAFALIYQINNKLPDKKNGVSSVFRTNSNQVHL
ncbi:MAG: hypothetical protein EOO87_16170 [Pedobacter sp.]|nr:MAG: hypothetical protein EOO87_16170 [Pedobacter sp.]